VSTELRVLVDVLLSVCEEVQDGVKAGIEESETVEVFVCVRVCEMV
jgi:hypothetical protein